MIDIPHMHHYNEKIVRVLTKWKAIKLPTFRILCTGILKRWDFISLL